MTVSTVEFASSANGDSWFLAREDGAAKAFVLHVANEPSGGTVTRSEIGQFLTRAPRAPEHEALLELIGTLVKSAAEA